MTNPPKIAKPRKQPTQTKARRLIETEKLYNDALKSYAKELGRLIHDWNDLHLELTQLFLVVCQNYEAEEESDILLALWNAVPNERFQREMLRQAARVRYSHLGNVMTKAGIDIEPIRDHEEAILKEILWVLEKADSLGRKRDDSAHVPTILEITMPLSFRFRAYDNYGHPIAKQLRDKELLSEFGLYRARIDAVLEHTRSLLSYLRGQDDAPSSLPEKPLWPSSPPSLEQKDGKELKPARPHSRRPRSSSP